MKTDKDVQVEDSQTLETPVSPVEPVKTDQTPAQRNFLQKAIPWVIVSLVFFLIGAALIFFTIYNTAKTELALSKTEATDLSEKLSSAEVDLEKIKNDLGTAQLSLADSQTALEAEKITSLLYKFQSDVNSARVALLKLDPSSSRQALTFATEDLAALSKTSINADSLSGLQSRIDTALLNLEADPQKAIEALDTLYTNLLLINDNLK